MLRYDVDVLKTDGQNKFGLSLRRLHALLLGGLVAACTGDAAGLEFQIAITGAVGLTDAAQNLRLAAWVDEAPELGSRPIDIFHIGESKNPDSVCQLGTEQNSFVCTSEVVVTPDADLYIGAFYEYSHSSNMLPSEGEFFAYVGPIRVPKGLSTVEDIEIKIVDPGAGLDTTVQEASERLIGVVVSGGEQAFLDLVHPFYSDQWNLTFEDVKSWVEGDFSSSNTYGTQVTYEDPLTAPVAGFFNTNIREDLNMAEVTVTTDNLNKNTLSADWEVEYKVKLSNAEGFFTVREDWRLSFQETETDLLLVQNTVVSQEIIGGENGTLEIRGGSFSNGLFSIDWDLSGTNADELLVGLDKYDPESHYWDTQTEVTWPILNASECTLGPGGTCVTSPPLDDFGFYRVRVHPRVSGTAGRPSTLYLPGDSYPY